MSYKFECAYCGIVESALLLIRKGKNRKKDFGICPTHTKISSSTKEEIPKEDKLN